MFAGISGVEWDAVELPSQFMENFVLEDSLNKWKHFDTGAQLPKDLQDKLKAQRTFMAGRYIITINY
jgi:oligopeptidase A